MCIGNERAVGGGGATSSGNLNDVILDSEPVNAGGSATDGAIATGWSTQIHAPAGSGTREVIAYGICASP